MLGTHCMNRFTMALDHRQATRRLAACMAMLLAPMLSPGLGLGNAQAQTRGELLYVTHCVACHNEQMHWRDKKQVVDWPSLKAQVQLWQATALLNWTEDDVQQVARHLNDTYYRLAAPPALGALAVALPARAPLR
jgi:cytochrome c553